MQQRGEERRREAERQEREAARPSLVVRDIEDVIGWWSKPIEIRVRLKGSQVTSETAFFYTVCLANEGIEDAENVELLISLPNSKFSHRLRCIGIQEEPVYTVQWDGTLEDFQQTDDAFARALVDDESISKATTTLGGRGSPRCFVLFFLVRGQRRVYLPSWERRFAASMPCSGLSVSLWLSAKGFGTRDVRRYVINAPTTNLEETRITVEDEDELDT